MRQAEKMREVRSVLDLESWELRTLKKFDKKAQS